MRRLSWTQFSMHEQCPYSWYAKYVLKLVPYFPYLPYAFGSGVHEAIEKCLRHHLDRNTYLTPVEMVGVVSEYMQKEGFTDPDVLQFHSLHAMNCINAWRSWLATVKFESLSLERKRYKGDFVGIVDWEVQLDGQRYIVDWKTSSKRYSQKGTDRDRQLTSYLWLTDSDPNEVLVAQGVLVKGLSVFQFLTSQRSQEDIDKFLEDLQKMREMIKSYKSGEKPVQKKGSHCRWCDVYKVEQCEGEDDF